MTGAGLPADGGWRPFLNHGVKNEQNMNLRNLVDRVSMPGFPSISSDMRVLDVVVSQNI